MKKVVVHQFHMGDVEDPDLWAAQNLVEFEQSEKGKWVMENTVDPTWHRGTRPMSWGWEYTIEATMTDEQFTYYKLKYE